MLKALCKRPSCRIAVATIVAIGIAFVLSPKAEFIQFNDTLSRIGMDYFHGSIGLTIIILAVLQVLTGVKFRKFANARAMHRYQGHVLYSLLLVQTAIGIFGW